MKRLVSDYRALRIKELAQGAWLHPFSESEWVWRANRGAQETTVRIIALRDSLTLVYRIQHDVQLTYSVGPRGGKRPWFSCPMCRRRVGVLYHGDNENLPFRCRICCELVYPSQYQSRDQSYGRRIRRLSHKERDRLMGHHRMAHDDFERSKGKSGTRYPDGYPGQSVEAVQRRIDSLKRRSR